MGSLGEDATLGEATADQIAELYGDQISPEAAPPPPPKPAPLVSEHWSPDLNPTQQQCFDDPADNVFGFGEKGSGKTVSFGNKLIRHLYENEDAFQLCLSPSIFTGSEGIWSAMERFVIPQWKAGIGLEVTPTRLDTVTKARHRWIGNRHGRWSKIVLRSIPHASQVEARIAGPDPSGIYIDELDKCDGTEYWTLPSSQLGRRQGVEGPQQFTASFNPKGPSHWLYKLLYEHFIDAKTKKRKPECSLYHFPIAENLHRLPTGYLERLQSIWSSDPVMWKRLIEGEWIDQPSGNALFKGFFSQSLHVRGEILKCTGLEPKPGYPIYIGYDIGQVFQAITFLQSLPVNGRFVWIAFDECDHLDEHVVYKVLAWEVIGRMRYWRRKAGYSFNYIHIADDSAVSQWRPGGEGSYDAWEFEREFNRVLDEFGRINAEGNVEPAKIIGCPRGAGSVEARVRMLQSKLTQDEFFISAQCENTVDCLNHLDRVEGDVLKPKRSRYLHKFDSITYPMFKTDLGANPGWYKREDMPAPRLIRVG